MGIVLMKDKKEVVVEKGRYQVYINRELMKAVKRLCLDKEISMSCYIEVLIKKAFGGTNER